MTQRKKTNVVKVRDLYIGGDHPISVQSMNNTDTCDVLGSLKQIEQLTEAGCEITRLAVLNEEAIPALKIICEQSPIPVVADIHFDYRLALKAIEAGCDAIRINPGNIGGEDRVKKVIKAAKNRHLPIRVGVNSGSLKRDIIDRYGGVNRESMVFSALQATELLEKNDFTDIVISIKASDPMLSIETYRLLSEKTRHPLHIGITEAGTLQEGTIRSAVGIGTLLAEGIGDTLRVSLTADPVEEIRVGYSILKSLGLRDRGALLVSCPTCGRTKVNLVELADKVGEMLKQIKEPIKVAVMGCAVNGPGEAKEADIGIAGGVGHYVLIKKGEIIKKVDEAEIFDTLKLEIDKIIAEKNEVAKITEA